MMAIDLYCGLGGWTEGLLTEGYDVIGFDTERHQYGAKKYLAQLVLQDVLTLHGAQFRNADLIVASPPCQEFSYRAMPWTRAKALPPPYLGMQLFWACFRIQQEACEAAGRYIPMVVENVVGAQRWVGDAKAHFGSYYLWGDVGRVGNAVVSSVPRFGEMVRAERAQSAKVASLDGGRRTDLGKGAQFTSRDCGIEGTKIGGDWFSDPQSTCRRHGSRSKARKAASAEIAKIPFALSQYIARCFKPDFRVVELVQQ